MRLPSLSQRHRGFCSLQCVEYTYCRLSQVFACENVGAGMPECRLQPFHVSDASVYLKSASTPRRVVAQHRARDSLRDHQGALLPHCLTIFSLFDYLP
jgi:hypothetical protein